MSEDKKTTATASENDNYSSKMVLDVWFQLWTSEDVKKDENSENWKRDVLIKMLVEGSGRDEDGIKSGVSTSFRYARNELVKALILKRMNERKDGEVYEARDEVAQSLSKGLGFGEDFSISCEWDKKKDRLKIGTIKGWDLPPLRKKAKAASTDWVGDFAAYLK